MIENHFQNISYLVIEVNSSCNLSCAFCNRKELVEKGIRSHKNLSKNEFQTMLSQLEGTSIDTIKLEGLSEPMLHPEFHDMAEILRKNYPSAFVIIATNLQYNLTKTSFLKTLPFVDMIYLSIDGTEDIYENARPGAKYSKLLKSLDDIKEHVLPEIRKQKLHINFTLSPQNYRELPKMYEIKDRLGLASVRINLAQNWNEHEENKLHFDQEVIEFLKDFKADVKGVGGWDYKDCFWPFSGIMVDVFGDVRQCIINTSMEPIGNLLTDDFKEIFNNSSYYKNLRKEISSGCSPKSCANCDYKKLSYTLSEIQGGRFATNSPRNKSFPPHHASQS